VFRHQQVYEVLANYRLWLRGQPLFKSRIVNFAFPQSLIGNDGDSHARMRDPLRQVFTRRRMEALPPETERIVDELLNDAGDATVDLIDRLAFPLPIRVVSSLLGVSVEEGHLFRRWVPALTGPLSFIGHATKEMWRACEDAGWAMHGYISEQVARRRRMNERPPDILTDLMAVEETGQLTSEEVVGNGMLFLIAAFETTQGALVGSLLGLFAHPEERAKLQQRLDDDAFLEQAINELLRYTSPTIVVSRFPTEDTVLDGTPSSRGRSSLFFSRRPTTTPSFFSSRTGSCLTGRTRVST
jgi:cytochrome P450